MTPPVPPGPISGHASALLAALRDAGSDGLPEARVRELGGRYWEGVLRRLCRRHPIGEQGGLYFLVGVGRAAGMPVDGVVRSEAPAGGPSSSCQLSLDVPVGSPHYREAA